MAILTRIRRLAGIPKWLYAFSAHDGLEYRMVLGVNPSQRWALAWAQHIADKMIECERRYLLIRART